MTIPSCPSAVGVLILRPCGPHVGQTGRSASSSRRRTTCHFSSLARATHLCCARAAWHAPKIPGGYAGGAAGRRPAVGRPAAYSTCLASAASERTKPAVHQLRPKVGRRAAVDLPAPAISPSAGGGWWRVLSARRRSERSLPGWTQRGLGARRVNIHSVSGLGVKTQ